MQARAVMHPSDLQCRYVVSYVGQVAVAWENISKIGRSLLARCYGTHHGRLIENGDLTCMKTLEKGRFACVFSVRSMESLALERLAQQMYNSLAFLFV